MMKSEAEKADAGLLHQLKEQKRRFIVLEPYQNTKAPTDEPGKSILSLHHYDALVTARLHSKTLKGKYAFIFDLENEGHFYKLQQLLSDSSYDIYTNFNIRELMSASIAFPMK